MPEEPESLPALTKVQSEPIQIETFPPFRRLLDDYLQLGSAKHNIHFIASFDVSAFVTFAAQCKVNRRRPPSIVACVARCLGVVLARHPRLMAATYRDKLLVPRHVNIIMTVSAKAGGDYLPLLMTIERTEEKTLAQIGTEMSSEARALRRRATQGEGGYKWGFWFAQRPPWLRRGIYRLCRFVPKLNRGLARYYSNIALTSVTQYAEGVGMWAFPVMAYSLGITMGGVSKKPVVVGDEIVARDCLDITLTVDHVITDGAAAAKFMAELGEEIVSGRLLAEFDEPIEARNAPA